MLLLQAILICNSSSLFYRLQPASVSGNKSPTSMIGKRINGGGVPPTPKATADKRGQTGCVA